MKIGIFLILLILVVSASACLTHQSPSENKSIKNDSNMNYTNDTVPINKTQNNKSGTVSIPLEKPPFIKD
jgi:cytochrome c biogenesis protein ResB